MAGQAAASVIATEDLSVATAIQRVISRGVFRIYTNHDVIGCELGGALKNVVAIAAGIAQGLGVGDNTRAAVMTSGLAELTRLGVAMGGEPADVRRAGRDGRPRHDVHQPVQPQPQRRRTARPRPQAEEILADMNMVAEGVKTAVTARELAKRHDVLMPVAEEIYRVGGRPHLGRQGLPWPARRPRAR